MQLHDLDQGKWILHKYFRWQKWLHKFDIKDTVPGIVEGLGRMVKPDFILNWDTDYFKNGDICLLGVLAVILVPLGFAKKIDFLGFTSAIGMFAMISFGRSSFVEDV